MLNPKGYLMTICRIGQREACCRYIIGDASGQHCAKLTPHLKGAIDYRVEQNSMVARGDNCIGRPLNDVLT